MKRNLTKRNNKHIKVEKNKKPKWLEFSDKYQSLFSQTVAILAIGISIYALYDSNKSSIENTKQLEKLSKHIDKQTEIANQQIEILRQQSELSKQQIKDNILSSAPILRISRCIFDPKGIEFDISNNGIRSAQIKGLRIFVAYKTNDKFLIEKVKEEIDETFCIPKNIINSYGTFKYTFENKDKMYIVIEVTYYDEYSGEEFILVNYFYDGKFEYGNEP